VWRYNPIRQRRYYTICNILVYRRIKPKKSDKKRLLPSSETTISTTSSHIETLMTSDDYGNTETLNLWPRES
jgi:hypothetical protein